MSSFLKVSVTIGIIALVIFQYHDPKSKGMEDQPLLSSNVSEWLRQGQFLDVFGHQMYYRICGRLEENEKVVIFFHRSKHPKSSFWLIYEKK